MCSSWAGHVFAPLPHGRSGWSPHARFAAQLWTLFCLTNGQVGLVTCCDAPYVAPAASRPKILAKGAQSPSPREPQKLDPVFLYRSHHILQPHSPEYSLLNLIYLQSEMSHDRTVKTKLEESDQYPKKKKKSLVFYMVFAAKHIWRLYSSDSAATS